MRRWKVGAREIWSLKSFRTSSSYGPLPFGGEGTVAKEAAAGGSRRADRDTNTLKHRHTHNITDTSKVRLLLAIRHRFKLSLRVPPFWTVFSVSPPPSSDTQKTAKVNGDGVPYQDGRGQRAEAGTYSGYMLRTEWGWQSGVLIALLRGPLLLEH